ncbi:MAG: hypothetical protein ABJE10_21605 [bacterium]
MTIDLHDGEMRRAYQALLREREGIRGQAVPLERMRDLVEGRGDEAERLATLDAVMADAESAKEFELLRALVANRPPTRVSWARRPYLLATVAAAAVIMIVAIPLARSSFGPVNTDPDRSGVQAAVLLRPSTEASPLTSRKFEWRSVTGARSYVLEILTSAGTPVFTTRTSDTTITLPPDVRIEPGVEHRWWVSSELADGSQRRSAFRRLMVRETK